MPQNNFKWSEKEILMKITFLDYASVFMKWRKFIIINSFLLCLITAIISLIIPKTFKSNTVILPPISEEGGFGISQLLSNLPIPDIGMGSMSEETNTFLAILDSRTVMESIVERFNLIQVYKVEDIEEAVKMVRGRVDVAINDDGTISLSTSHKTGYFAGKEEDEKTREFVQNLTAAFLEELDNIHTRIKIEKARNNRLFIEKRYFQNLADLSKAEEDFKHFQETYGVVALPEQTAASIEAAAELRAQITMKEIQLGILSKYVSSTHSDIIHTKGELTELRRKFNELKTGDDSDSDGDSKKIFLPFNDVPELGMNYYRLYREVAIQQKLMEFLLPEYEQAKIQEARDTPTVQVLDPPSKPIKRSSPKRMFLVLLAGIFSVVLFMIAAYIFVNLEYIKQSENERYEQIQTIIQQLKPTRWFN